MAPNRRGQRPEGGTPSCKRARGVASGRGHPDARRGVVPVHARRTCEAWEASAELAQAGGGGRATRAERLHVDAVPLCLCTRQSCKPSHHTAYARPGKSMHCAARRPGG